MITGFKITSSDPKIRLQALVVAFAFTVQWQCRPVPKSVSEFVYQIQDFSEYLFGVLNAEGMYYDYHYQPGENGDYIGFIIEVNGKNPNDRKARDLYWYRHFLKDLRQREDRLKIR